MKIAVDARTMGSCPSGVGIYLYDFIRELISYSEFEILLITDVSESEQMHFFELRKIPVLCYGKKVFRSAGVYLYFEFLRKILVEQQPELFWEPNNLLPIALHGYHGKTVLTIHDLFPITKPEYFHWLYRLYFKVGIRKSVKQADAFLFNSVETRNLAQLHLPETKKKRCFVSYLIVKSPPSKTISDDGFFLYIGNLERRKGTDLLLKAYQAYHADGGKYPLFIGGKIREEDMDKLLKSTQRELPEIRYLGYLKENEKYELLAKCSCFLFPSRAEGFGIPPLEALGYQKKIITSNLSVFKEIIKIPVQTFHLNVSEDEQIRELCCLMRLNEDVAGPSAEICDDALKHYRHDILGEKLARFFISVASNSAEDVNENCL